MDNWIEPPPPKQQRGCFRGCLFIFLFLLVVVAAIAVISYRSVTSGKVPPVQPEPEVAEEARSRWDQFEQTTSGEVAPATPYTTPGAEPSPVTSGPARVEFGANDINQLITANKKASGKAFVRIENNVLHADVAIPLKKLKFGDRQLIISGEVHASADHDPHKLSIRNLKLGGVDFPESVLNSMLRGRSLSSYVDEYAQKYQVTGFAIENNQVVLEGAAQNR